MFDVGRSMFNVRRSYSFFRREVLNAERALASLEKSGEALTNMAGGNVRRSRSIRLTDRTFR